MQFPIDNILIQQNDFMNEIRAFVTVNIQIPTSNLKHDNNYHVSYQNHSVKNSIL